MTSRRFPANLRLEIKPSRLLCLYLLASHVAVLLSVLLCGVDGAPLLAAALLLIASCGYHLISVLRQTGPYPATALACREGQWFLQTHQGERSVILKQSWVLPYAVGVHLLPGGYRLVLPDSVRDDDFRRLRQILRFAWAVPGVENGVERLG